MYFDASGQLVASCDWCGLRMGDCDVPSGDVELGAIKCAIDVFGACGSVRGKIKKGDNNGNVQ
jgi:hypothetical protein